MAYTASACDIAGTALTGNAAAAPWATGDSSSPSDHRLPLQGEPPLGVGGCLPWAPLLHLNPGRISAFSPFGRMVKIFMRRGCSTGVSRQGVLDSACHVADRAQAELGRGRAARCSCLDGCVLRDNALGTGGALSLTSVPRTGSGGTSTPL